MERPVVTNLLGHASKLDKHQKLKQSNANLYERV